MIGLVLLVAFAAGVTLTFFYAARWAFASDRQKSLREDVTEFKSDVDRFLHDPLHFQRKGP